MPHSFRCRMCGKDIQQPPIMLPVGRMRIIKNKPGFYSIDKIKVCLDCVRANLDTIEEKMKNGEFFPVQVWATDKVGITDAIYVTEKGHKTSRELFPNSNYF